MLYYHIAMVVPNRRGIYAPVDIVEEQDGLTSSITGLVSFACDKVSDPVEMDFYGDGLNCWYIRRDEVCRQ